MIRHHEREQGEDASRLPRTLSWTAFSILCAFAAVMLPLSASLAQQAQPPATAQPGGNPFIVLDADAVPQPEPRQPQQPQQPAQVGQTALAPIAPIAGQGEGGLADERDIARAIEQELEQTRLEINRLTERLHRARARLTELQLAHAHQGLGRARDLLVDPAAKPPPAHLRWGNRGVGQPALTLPQPGAPNAANQPDQERRLRSVEEKLDLLMEELRAMRQFHQDRPDRGAGGR